MGIPLHTQLAFIVQVVVCAVGIARFRNHSIQLKIVAVYFIVSTAFSVCQFYLASKRINNLWLTHLFTPIQYAFFAWTLSLWQRNVRLQRVVQISVLAFAAMCFASIILLEDLRIFNNYSRPLESILLVVLSGYGLFLIKELETDSLMRQPAFWASAAILLYFSGMVVLYSLSNSLLHASVGTLRVAWIAHSIVSVISNSFFAAAFLCRPAR